MARSGMKSIPGYLRGSEGGEMNLAHMSAQRLKLAK